MDIYFNFNRFFLVLKRDFIENGKTALFGILTILSIFSFILVMISFESNDKGLYDFNATFYMMEFFIIGIFFAGMAFKDFRNKEKTMSYLMLPASSFEKFLSMLMLTTIGFFVSYTLLFELFNLLNIVIIGSLPNALNLELFNPFIPELGKVILVLIPIQALFLIGAATFKKAPLFYTVLYFFVFLLIYGFVIGLVLKYYTGAMNIRSIGDNTQVIYFSGEVQNQKEINSILSIQTFIFFLTYLLAPIFWLITWFKIKEKEV